MSVQALSWAYSRAIPPEMNPTDRFVLVTLANFADDQGRAWPSLSTLARSTNLHRGTVTRSIARLEETYGAITKLRSGGGPRGRSNVYKLAMGSLQLTRELDEHEVTRSFDEPAHDELLKLLDSPEGSQSATPTPVDNSAKGSQSATPDGARSATPATGGVAENDQTWSRSARRPVREQSLNTTHAQSESSTADRPCHGGHIDRYGDPVACGVNVPGCSAFKLDEDTKLRGLVHIEEMRERLRRRTEVAEQAPNGGVR